MVVCLEGGKRGAVFRMEVLCFMGDLRANTREGAKWLGMLAVTVSRQDFGGSFCLGF